MAIQVHTVEVPDGLDGFAQTGWIMAGLQLAVAYGAGGSAGATVTAAVTIPASANLPANYAVFPEVDAKAVAWITGKSSTGFTVNVAPLVATDTLGAGTVNLLIVA